MSSTSGSSIEFIPQSLRGFQKNDKSLRQTHQSSLNTFFENKKLNSVRQNNNHVVKQLNESVQKSTAARIVRENSCFNNKLMNRDQTAVKIEYGSDDNDGGSFNIMYDKEGVPTTKTLQQKYADNELTYKHNIIEANPSSFSHPGDGSSRSGTNHFDPRNRESLTPVWKPPVIRSDEENVAALNNLYINGVKSIKAKHQWQEAAKSIEDERQLKKCSFRPEISTYAKTVARPSSLSPEHRYQAELREKRDYIQKMRQNLEKKELNKCTFRPLTVNAAKLHPAEYCTRKDVTDRLYNEALFRKLIKKKILHQADEYRYRMLMRKDVLVEPDNLPLVADEVDMLVTRLMERKHRKTNTEKELEEEKKMFGCPQINPTTEKLVKRKELHTNRDVFNRLSTEPVGKCSTHNQSPCELLSSPTINPISDLLVELRITRHLKNLYDLLVVDGQPTDIRASEKQSGHSETDAMPLINFAKSAMEKLSSVEADEIITVLKSANVTALTKNQFLELFHSNPAFLKMLVVRPKIAKRAMNKEPSFTPSINMHSREILASRTEDKVQRQEKRLEKNKEEQRQREVKEMAEYTFQPRINELPKDLYSGRSNSAQKRYFFEMNRLPAQRKQPTSQEILEGWVTSSQEKLSVPDKNGEHKNIFSRERTPTPLNRNATSPAPFSAEARKNEGHSTVKNIMPDETMGIGNLFDRLPPQRTEATIQNQKEISHRWERDFAHNKTDAFYHDQSGIRRTDRANKLHALNQRIEEQVMRSRSGGSVNKLSRAGGGSSAMMINSTPATHNATTNDDDLLNEIEAETVTSSNIAELDYVIQALKKRQETLMVQTKEALQWTSLELRRNDTKHDAKIENDNNTSIQKGISNFRAKSAVPKGKKKKMSYLRSDPILTPGPHIQLSRGADFGDLNLYPQLKAHGSVPAPSSFFTGGVDIEAIARRGRPAARNDPRQLYYEIAQDARREQEFLQSRR